RLASRARTPRRSSSSKSPSTKKKKKKKRGTTDEEASLHRHGDRSDRRLPRADVGGSADRPDPQHVPPAQIRDAARGRVLRGQPRDAVARRRDDLARDGDRSAPRPRSP